MEDSWPPRYRDYLADSAAVPEPPIQGLVQHLEPRALIAGSSDGSWSAIHESDDGLLGDFDSGTRDEAVAWAEARCPRIFIFDHTVGDYVDLHGAGARL